MPDEICEKCQPAFEKLEKKVAELVKYVQVLETRLARFMNPHTPPSIARNYKNHRADDGKPKGIPGQKPGHEGTTRKQPEPQRHITALAQRCTNCSLPLSSPIAFERRLIEDIPPPPPLSVTEFMLAIYKCAACGARIVATHPECPDEGVFGKNVLAFVSLMKNDWRMPYRMICETLWTLYGFDMTPATALDINRRVADVLEPEYKEIEENVQNADIVYTDETSAPVQGENQWNWAFSTPTDAFFAIRNSRGTGVLDEILGDEFDGAMVNDGWKPYEEYANKHGLQMGRCWAHILREADDLDIKVRSSQGIAAQLHGIFDMLDGELEKNPSAKKRKRLRSAALQRLRRITWKRYRNPATKKFIAKLERARFRLLTYVIVPGMEPTNNRSERNLRESVVQRKIIGTLRNEKGTRIQEIMMSVLTTWQLRQLNVYQELLKRLS